MTWSSSSFTSSQLMKLTKVNGQKLETVTSFKYLGSVVPDQGSKPEILSRIAQTTAALTRLKPVWNDKSISLSSKYYRWAPMSHPSSCMLVNHGPRRTPKNTSHGNEVLPQDVTHFIQKSRYQRGSLFQLIVGLHECLQTIVKRRKLQWYGHVSRSQGLAKIILQGTVKGGRQGRQKNRWEDNIREWTGSGVRPVPKGSRESRR